MAQVKRYRPEKPIYLSTENTGCKNRDQVLLAVQQLRDLGWLCAYSNGELLRPFHLCFLDPKQFQEFKKDAENLKIKLKSPVITPEAIEDLSIFEAKAGKVDDTKSSVEDPAGRVHIEA